jgi:hypothetical protein
VDVGAAGEEAEGVSKERACARMGRMTRSREWARGKKMCLLEMRERMRFSSRSRTSSLGGKEGRREGGKEGRRKGGKEGRREGGEIRQGCHTYP